MEYFKLMPPFFWFEVAAFLAATLHFFQNPGSYLKWFAPFLLFILIVEIMGFYLPKVLHWHNAWVFNFSVPVEYLFYTFIYSKSLPGRKYKKFIFGMGISYLFLWITILATTNIHIFQNPLLMVGNLLAVLYSCLFFFEVLRSDKVMELHKEPMFWIACGVFLFNIGELTYTLFRPVLTANRWDVTLSIFKAINNKLIFWLYGCIAIGLLCRKPTIYRKMSD